MRDNARPITADMLIIKRLVQHSRYVDYKEKGLVKVRAAELKTPGEALMVSCRT